MLWVGITGGVGSGKSTVADLFHSTQGIPIISADVVARRLTTEQGKALPLIRQIFGSHLFLSNGLLDRNKLRTLIFSHPDKKQQLEAILHPMIFDEIQRQQNIQYHANYGLIEIPLLVEAPQFHQLIQRVLVIDTPVQLQFARILERDNISTNQATAIITAQAQRQQRLEIADDILINDSNMDKLNYQVAQLHLLYSSLASLNYD